MLPKNRADADVFYRTLDLYTLALARECTDPWAEIPWEVDERHAEIIAKLYAGDHEHHDEIEAFLAECMKLAGKRV